MLFQNIVYCLLPELSWVFKCDDDASSDGGLCGGPEMKHVYQVIFF